MVMELFQVLLKTLTEDKEFVCVCVYYDTLLYIIIYSTKLFVVYSLIISYATVTVLFTFV